MRSYSLLYVLVVAQFASMRDEALLVDDERMSSFVGGGFLLSDKIQTETLRLNVDTADKYALLFMNNILLDQILHSEG